MKNKSTVIIIPARMGSSRFPGKPLAPLLGKPMLHWVIANAVKAIGRSRTFLASCDREILEFAESEGVRGILTSSSHERASDRTHEAVEVLIREREGIEHVLMLQGDEPTISPTDIMEAVQVLESAPKNQIVNLMGEIRSKSEWEDPNTVKVVVGNDCSALYFSRSPIPHGLVLFPGGAHKQVCAIGFSITALREYSKLKSEPLEEIESIDMLRWLAHGNPVRMVPICSATHPVDVPSDILTVEQILKNGNY